MKCCQTCKEHLPRTAFYGGGKYPRCKTCDKEAQNKFKINNPQKFRLNAAKKRLKHSYNLEWEDYLNLCKEQNDVCKICGKDNKGWQLAVDHCHQTGKVRGLLCNTCNRAIGLFKDNPDLIDNASNYLRSKTH